MVVVVVVAVAVVDETFRACLSRHTPGYHLENQLTATGAQRPTTEPKRRGKICLEPPYPNRQTSIGIHPVELILQIIPSNVGVPDHSFVDCFLRERLTHYEHFAGLDEFIRCVRILHFPQELRENDGIGPSASAPFILSLKISYNSAFWGTAPENTPLPSASTSKQIPCNSSSMGYCPGDRILAIGIHLEDHLLQLGFNGVLPLETASLPSASTSKIISCNSAAMGYYPRGRHTAKATSLTCSGVPVNL